MDYRFYNVNVRLSNLESGISIYSTTYNYSVNGDVESLTYINGNSEVVLIEYFYNINGDVDYSTGKLDTVLQYTETFNYNANGDIINTVVT